MAFRKNYKPNYFYSIVSVTLVLLLLGLFGMLILEGRQLVKQMKEKVEIIVELKDGHSEADVQELESFLQKSAFYKSGSLKFLSKEDGAKMMQDEFGETFLKLDMANPLYDVLIFNMKADYVATSGMEEMKERIKGYGQVSDVYYQESVADAIAVNLQKISFGVLVAGLFFVVVAVALILNTIRLALYANRFLIKNMELVGASWEFISRPFLWKSFWHGLVCGLLAVGLLATLVYAVFSSMTDPLEILVRPVTLLLFFGLIVLGMLISVSSTYYVVNKYLKMRVDELY